MAEKHVAHGVLFYASLYINGILLAVAAITGRWIFLLLILLTLGLTAYMMYVASSNTEFLQNTGEWAEKTFLKALEKIKSLYKP